MVCGVGKDGQEDQALGKAEHRFSEPKQAAGYDVSDPVGVIAFLLGSRPIELVPHVRPEGWSGCHRISGEASLTLGYDALWVVSLAEIPMRDDCPHD